MKDDEWCGEGLCVGRRRGLDITGSAQRSTPWIGAAICSQNRARTCRLASLALQERVPPNLDRSPCVLSH